MTSITLLFVFLLAIFVGMPATYYLYMRRLSKDPWNIRRDLQYSPSITVIIPMHNEEKIIRLKLENLLKIVYPRDKLQIIVVDDSSEDASVPAVVEFQKSSSEVKIDLLENKGPRGKVESLNLALENSNGDIIVVSDADCFWRPEALVKAVEFLSDPSIGAVTGLELLLNSGATWVTETELMYNDVVHTIRIGESKFYSTIIFQGGFGAYKRSLLEKFDAEADDSGTALSIVQKGARAILVSDVVYFTMFPRNLMGKMTTKLRRASTLAKIWFRGLALLLKREIILPNRILLFEAFLHLVNPFVFLLLVLSSILVSLENPILFLVFFGFLFAFLLNKSTRMLLIETVQNQLFLIGAILSLVFRWNFRLWSAELDTRDLLTRDMLERCGLV